jgi:hypothetical protein
VSCWALLGALTHRKVTELAQDMVLVLQSSRLLAKANTRGKFSQMQLSKP